MVIAMAASLTVLAVFKYFNFVAETVAALSLSVVYSPVTILLPIGISFFTFQALSYVFDVYRGAVEPERHLGIFATYIAFFPQLLAGPLTRASVLIPQLRAAVAPTEEDMVAGMRLVLWGAFKKVVVADTLALYVNAVFDHPKDHTGLTLVLATFFFAFQIYCDFSGYSAIAIGAARMLGIRLAINFRQPYLATSIRDFWRRWHISLSTWFRDYIYIPLGGNRAGLVRTLLSILIVFALSGLWHGARWTFVIWGLIHGVMLVAQALLERAQRHPRWGKALRWPPLVTGGITFLLVCLAWVFFRANSFDDALYIFSHMFSGNASMDFILAPFERAALAPRTMLLVAILLIGLVILSDGLISHPKSIQRVAGVPRFARWIAYYAAALLILISLLTHASAQFIYFQF
ncbi:MAG: MBOAT family protein [Anaerolineae bacterium]|nr:MBOAT family protein [Anaerolineae bacterium]